MNPLAEVFGFPIVNETEQAIRYRSQKLCPFHNKVPNCTKDKANDPLGVCSIYHGEKPVITCPIRFREEWLIIEHAARFAFPENAKWTSLSEIKPMDRNGQSAGNVDFVLVAYDDRGKLLDFTSLEVQGVCISGNVRNPFDHYMKTPNQGFTWKTSYNYPKPDYLSSSRKRLIPQLLYKGGIFQSWGKKQSVALQKTFFDTLPALPITTQENADIAWFLYDLVQDASSSQYRLQLSETVFTEFEPALRRVATPDPGNLFDFMGVLQDRLDERLDGYAPDAPSLMDFIGE